MFDALLRKCAIFLEVHIGAYNFAAKTINKRYGEFRRIFKGLLGRNAIRKNRSRV